MPVVDSYLTIGVILSSVGLQGEVKCALMTDFPERFLGLSSVVVEAKEGRKTLHVKRVRHASHFVYLMFEESSSREDADLLRGLRVQVLESERAPLPKDHYYQYELEGVSVFLEEGTHLGTLTSVLETGGNDVYLVKKEDREYLIPALKSVVKKIDLVKREMVICPMDGLLDL